MYERTALRYAHTTGFTSLIYMSSGECIITCGSDGDIRRWRGIDDDDPSSNCLGEFVLCLVEKDGKILAATDRNTVQAYTYPDFDKDGTVMRFTAPVICMKAIGDYLAAGSEDTKIQLLKDGDAQPIELIGHKGPVLALDIHPKGSLLASASGDGTIKIWDLENSGKEFNTIHGLSKTNSYENAKYFGAPCFQPSDGQVLVYVIGKEVIVISTISWKIQFTMTDNAVKGDYTCCQFSYDGTFLAAGTDKGEISIYNFSTHQTFKCEAPPVECQAITCLAWINQDNKELAYCDSSGQLGTVFCNSLEDENAFISNMCDGDSNDMDDIQFAEGIAINSNGKGLQNEITDVTTPDNYTHNFAPKSTVVEIDSITEGVTQRNEEHSRDSGTRAHSFSPFRMEQQPAFQPSSTPENLEHRYLVWNDIGIVTLHGDASDGAIEVEFHDTTVHHALHIPNCQNHNMASLSSSILVLASSNSSKLVCITLNASGNKEWSTELPNCESIEAVVATTKLVAVATSMQFVRIYTVMGTQREIVSISGPVVCLAGYEDRILICYHAGPPNIKQQHLCGMLLQISGLRLKCHNITIPLPPERQLNWMGFSDNGSPVIYDTMGLLQLFNIRSNCWYPICDTMSLLSSISNNYFIISISERLQVIQAILCRAASYPMTNPRPMVQELRLQLPLCDLESEKSSLEDTLIRNHIMTVDDSDRTIKETAIKLFALSCRNEVEARAKELIEILACPEILNLAIKYATKLGRLHLSGRLYELLPHIEALQDNVNQNKEWMPSFIQTSHQKPLSTSADLLSSENILAPKPVDITSAKKSTLKRFTLNRDMSPNVSTKSSSHTDDVSLMATPIEEDTNNSNGVDVNNATNSPTVTNPFATKRKIFDVDKGGIVMGSEKLKLIKK